MPSQDRRAESVRTEAARWITERDAGLLTRDGEAELARWLAADPAHRHAYGRLEKMWREMGHASDTTDALREANILPFRAAKKLPQRWLGGAIAASAALMMVGSANDWPTRMHADAMTATGEQRDVALADGSTIKLNSGSAVAIHYGDRARAIELLKGEAAFVVAADPSRPFTVTSGDGSTTALGTRFNIRRTGGNTEVTVTEHSVRVAARYTATSPTVVREGQATGYGVDGLVKPHQVDTDVVTAWTRGRLMFVDRPLNDVVAELNRYHSGYIYVLGSSLGDRRFSGVLPISDPIAALNTIEQSLGIGSTRITNRLIFLHG